jgi:hypothetical protein
MRMDLLMRSGLVAVALAIGVRAEAEPRVPMKRSSKPPADDKLGPRLETLRQRYTITDAAVGAAPGFNAHGEKGWSARLQSPSLGRVEFSLFLSMRDGALASTAPFLRDAEELVSRASSVRWLLRYLGKFPQSKLTIFYFDDRSISASAKPEVIARVHAARTIDDEQVVGAHLDRAIAIEVPIGKFILMPDGTTVVYAIAPSTQLKASVGDFLDTDGEPLPLGPRNRE